MIPLCCETAQVAGEQNVAHSVCSIAPGKDLQYQEINSKHNQKLCENNTNLIHVAPVKQNTGKDHYFCQMDWRQVWLAAHTGLRTCSVTQRTFKWVKIMPFAVCLSGGLISIISLIEPEEYHRAAFHSTERRSVATFEVRQTYQAKCWVSQALTGYEMCKTISGWW